MEVMGLPGLDQRVAAGIISSVIPGDENPAAVGFHGDGELPFVGWLTYAPETTAEQKQREAKQEKEHGARLRNHRQQAEGLQTKQRFRGSWFFEICIGGAKP
jgi:hypothetical protein